MSDYKSIQPKIVGEVVGQFVPSDGAIRDDTTRAFSEPYPLMSFDMPPVRSSSPEFVHVSVVRTAVDAWAACDPARLDAAMEAIRNTIDPTNANTGPAAPIQGQG